MLNTVCASPSVISDNGLTMWDLLKKRTVLVFFVCVILSLGLLRHVHQERGYEVVVTLVEERPPQKWISLSVCFGSSALVYKKKNFPYLLAAKLSTVLWTNKTDARVLVQVVHDEDDERQELQTYAEELSHAGAAVRLVPTSSSVGCVLQSQLQRMLAFNDDLIKDDDIIVTSDVDVFVMDETLLDITDDSQYLIWVYQYALSESSGTTFGMSFLGMTKWLWRRLLHNAESAEALLSFHAQALAKNFTWNYDQVIASRVILGSGICSLPPANPMWDLLGMQPVEGEASSVAQCFHGDGFQDCNRDRPSLGPGIPCKIWHFLPYERQGELEEKFEQILYHHPPKIGLMKTVQDVTLEMQKLLGFRD